MRVPTAIYFRPMSTPGSPCLLSEFARWCRIHIDHVVAADQVPALLFADGPDFDEALAVSWHLDGIAPATEELLTHLIPAWTVQSSASQIAVSVPFGRPHHGVSLVALDESEYLIEQAHLDVDRLRLGDWEAIRADLDVTAWQAQLAHNAGWEEFAKWRCRRCNSVCAGEATIVPSPCDYCAATEIDRVPLATALRDPDPPYSPFVATLFEINGRSAARG